MKNIYLITIAFLFVIGCNNKEDAKIEQSEQQNFNFDSTDIKSTPITDLSKSLLNYNLQKGKKYNYRLTSLTEDNQTIIADTTMNQFIKQNLVYLISLDINEVESDGTIETAFEFTSVKLNAEANGKKFSYQSGMKLDSMDRLKYIDYEALINNPFTVRIAKTGEIIDIFKTDKIVNKFLDLTGKKDKVTFDEKKMFQDEMTNGVIKTMVAQVFRKVPTTEVLKDSSWSFRNPPVNLQLFNMDNTNTYKLTSFEKFNDDNLAVINAGIISKIKISDQITKQNITLKQPEFTADGKIYFNLSKGLIQKSKTKTHLKIEVSTQVPTPKGMQKVMRKQNTITTNILEFLG